MQLQEIEKRVEELQPETGFEFIFELLRAYGFPKASLTRLEKGTYNRSTRRDELLWKDKVWYRYVRDNEDLHGVIDAARSDPRIAKERPRFLVVRDQRELLAVDTREGASLATDVANLGAHATFFGPWAGYEKRQLVESNYADRRAAERLALLYDEIARENTVDTSEAADNLNLFFARLLFCYFAEDTGVFVDDTTADRKGLFTNTIASLTREDGSDTAPLLRELFRVLDLDPVRRVDIKPYFASFGYVNGKLFSDDVPVPRLSARARRIIIESGSLEWSEINPDIFGSMFQAVVLPGQRESLGMHYTSVDNILQVLNPLILDELGDAFHAADTTRKLDQLLDRIARIKFLDPACGSGNFLVIAYKELRRLEHRILQRTREIDPTRATLFANSAIQLDHFYGIEIDRFARELATLSLWLAKHQMNVEFKELFGVDISLIPLRDAGKIVCANATRVDWGTICDVKANDEVVVVGNPPYLGARNQDAEQKGDLQSLEGFGDISNNLDYVSAWFLKGAQFVVEHSASLGFISTNSICQGEQVALLWPKIYAAGADISFAVTSFKWTNLARGNAGVSCVIVGLRADGAYQRRLYSSQSFRSGGGYIAPYLSWSHRRTVVGRAQRPITTRPELTFGSMPNDAGNLVLTSHERSELLARDPEAERFIRKFVGAEEFLNSKERYVLWIDDSARAEAERNPEIRRRIAAVELARARSRRAATQKLAAKPHRFGEVRHQPGSSIIIPSVSSERRQYIPMGFLDDATVISNAASAIYDAEPWIFAVVQSRLHMVWVRAVAGRLKTDYRYSAVLCYNTFPLPVLSDGDREALAELAFGVLDARAFHPGATLAELYTPGAMPRDLLIAHERLDAAVEERYRKRPFDNDDERLEHLFDRYESAVGGIVA